MLLFGTLFWKSYDNGWSETYPIEQDTYADGATALEALRDARKPLLVNDCEIVAARLSDTAVKGDSYNLGWTFPVLGTYASTPADATGNLDLAMRIKAFGGTLKRSSRWIHAIPTSQISVGGTYTPAGTWAAKLTTFFGALEANTKIATKIPGAIAPPFYTFTAIDSLELIAVLVSRAIGRPFGLRPGRRRVA